MPGPQKALDASQFLFSIPTVFSSYFLEERVKSKVNDLPNLTY